MTNNSEMVASTKDQRQGGSIQIDLLDNMHLSQSHISSESTALDGGAAGKISVNAENSIHLIKNSALTTEAINADDNESVGKGTIITTAKNLIYLQDSKITSSVLGGIENAGNINAFADTIAMNRSQIIAKADQGRGGNIHIVAEQFIQSTNSTVDASSNKGIDGLVTIESPEMNASSALGTMPTDLLDASRWLRTPCNIRTTEEISRLIVRSMDASPTTLDDLWPSPPFEWDQIDIDNCSYLNNKDDQSIVNQLLIQGYQTYQKGEYFKSAAAFRKILATPQISRCKEIYYATLFCFKQTMCAIGYHQEALDAYEKALPTIEACDHCFQDAIFYSRLGDLYLSLRHIPKAKKYLNIAMKISRNADIDFIKASVLNNMANLCFVENRFEGAIKRYEKCLSYLENASQQTRLKSTILLNLIDAYLKTNNHQLTQAINTSLTHIQKLPESHDKAAFLIGLSLRIQEIQSRVTNSDTYLSQMAIQILENALWLAEDQTNQRLLSLANGYMGQIFEQQNMFEQAFQFTRKARFIAQESCLNELLYVWEWQLGRLFRKTEQDEHAFLSYKNAMNTLKPIRQQLFVGIRRFENAFAKKVRPIYLGIADLFLKRTDFTSDKKDQESNLQKAIDTMEILKQAEMQDYFEDECLTSIQETRTGLDQIPANSAVLYPVPMPDHLSILLKLPEGMKHIKIPVNNRQLSQTVKKCRSLLEDWDLVDEWKDEWYGNLHEGLEASEIMAVAQKLYQWIIHPIEKELIAANIKTLLVAPDGVLRLIPFSVLSDGYSFLIEKYAVVTIPAISLTDMRSRSGQPNTGKVLLAGLSKKRHGCMPLKGVKKELNSINAMINGEILMNENYTVPKIKQKFKVNNYSIVHFATHGVFGGTPDETYLLTYDRKLTMNHLEQLIQLTQLNQKNIDLLVLSACQTAQGNERAAFGLAGVALKAGAKSAIATLWTVDDQAASSLLVHFYEQLSYDRSKAEALQSAMKQLILDTKYCHPSYWAPFLLIGDWM